MALYRWNNKLAWVWSAPWTVYLTQSEYDLLPSSKTSNNINYWIYVSAQDHTISKFIKNWTEYTVWGWSEPVDLPMKVLPLNWFNDTTWAQNILDAVLAGDYVVLKDTSVSGMSRFFYPNQFTWSRLEFIAQALLKWDWSTSEPVSWSQTWRYIAERRLRINYSWTTVTSITEPTTTDWAIRVSWYTS